MDTKTVPYQSGALSLFFGGGGVGVGGRGEGVNSLVVFSTHFNPNNPVLISLQISLLFMSTPAIKIRDNGNEVASD